MTQPSQKMGLVLPSTVDPFSTADIKGNWEKIDAAPGSHICTSSTRPVWTAAQAGRKIIETNTQLEWMWTGTEFVRLTGSGLLRRSDGSWAIGERTTTFQTSSSTPVKLVSVTSVVVPNGRRPLKIEASWHKARTTGGGTFGYFFRSNTNNSGAREASWSFGTTSDDAVGGGGTFFALVPNGLAAGTYDWSVQVTAPNGGEGYWDAFPATPFTILVTEL